MRNFLKYILVSLVVASCGPYPDKPDYKYEYQNYSSYNLEVKRYLSSYAINEKEVVEYSYRLNKNESIRFDEQTDEYTHFKNLRLDSVKILFEDGKEQLFRRNDYYVNLKRHQRGPMGSASQVMTDQGSYILKTYIIDDSVYQLEK
ncbi:hypothetical protein CHU00_10165 [Sphingobacterium cellulitidis]|nr:hypothetical protein CHU00_10165 [Sphingobacterium cellulitidis]